MPSGSSDRGVGSSSLDWIRMEVVGRSRSPGLEGSCGASVRMMRQKEALKEGEPLNQVAMEKLGARGSCRQRWR